jgi:hypothetical protein
MVMEESKRFRLVPLEVKSKYFFCSPESISQPDLRAQL